MRNPVVAREEWRKARLELLAAEKKFTRQRDALTERVPSRTATAMRTLAVLVLAHH